MVLPAPCSLSPGGQLCALHGRSTHMQAVHPVLICQGALRFPSTCGGDLVEDEDEEEAAEG